MEAKIAEITSEETLNIRHKVMWPSKSIDYVRISNDDKGRHFGLFINDKMISVISLFIVNKEAQFRKFATLTDYQGKGFGTVLLKEIMNIVKHNNLNKIWCNARIDKSKYYTKFGMVLTGNKFIKGGIEYVIMEKILD
ncbi:GNAT family N-acetyltransferase [Zobellia laminariae]|uniref:GNAT family N-acetyltransferase n=1 Tax=Zobellia laminariae TaxID=248906 RepID=UPI0026F43905|nr:GNAT family N-acetyltransferase [Zobellia laminariae]WKX76282.1 GNAT family N-acetyltransferase [Zobellia laminariae]